MAMLVDLMSFVDPLNKILEDFFKEENAMVLVGNRIFDPVHKRKMKMSEMKNRRNGRQSSRVKHQK